MMINMDLLLAHGAAFKKLKAGEIIFSEGHSCFFYHQLVSGKAKWINVTDEGRECIHYIIEPGDSFGELPLFDDKPYAAAAVALEDVVILRLHKADFLHLLKEQPELHFAFTKLISNRLRFKFSMIQSFASHSPEHMIATVINQFKAENKNFCGECNQLNLTRQQLADMTGLRVETVIRTMKHMHEKGELRISKGKVYCTDMIELTLN